MEYGTGIAIVNKNESLRVGHVMGGFVAIVGSDNFGMGTGDIAGGRNEREWGGAELAGNEASALIPIWLQSRQHSACPHVTGSHEGLESWHLQALGHWATDITL